MRKKILNVVFGIIVLGMGTFLGIALFMVFSGRIKIQEGMAFGILMSMIGCPVMIYTGISFIFSKNPKLD